MIFGINASELRGNWQVHNAEEKKLRKGREEVLSRSTLAWYWGRDLGIGGCLIPDPAADSCVLLPKAWSILYQQPKFQRLRAFAFVSNYSLTLNPVWDDGEKEGRKEGRKIKYTIKYTPKMAERNGNSTKFYILSIIMTLVINFFSKNT